VNAVPSGPLAERVAFVLLALFVFTIPFEKSVLIPGVGTIARLLGILALCAGGYHAARRRTLRRPNLALVWMAVFVAWAGMTRIWSLAPETTSLRFLTFVQLLCMAWLVWEYSSTGDRQRWLLRAYVAGAWVSSVITLIRYGQGLQTYYRRFAATGFDPNDLGLTLALSLPLAMYLALRDGKLARWVYRGGMLLAIAALLLTASRGAFVAALLAFGFAAATWMQSGLAGKLSSAALLVLLLAGALRLAPAASRERLSTLPEELASGTLHNRTRIWEAGLKALRQYPFHGAGAGAYPQAVRPWLGRPAREGHEYVAHNTFLSVLVECGLIGFALFASLLATLLLFIYFMPAVERALWVTMLAVWVAGASLLTWEHRKPSWLLFALIMAGWARAFHAADEST